MNRAFRSAILLPLLLSIPLASAADTPASNDEWQFALSPMFLWGMSMKGDSQIGAVDTPLDLEFADDVLSNLDAVFTVHFEAKKGDWVLFSEVQYVDLEPTVNAQKGRVPISADVTFKNTMVELGAARRVAQFEKTDLELLFGARYTKQQNHTKLEDGTTLVDVKEDWWDGFAGGRVTTRISDNWKFEGRGDIGAGGSDLVWNLGGFFDYRFKDWGSVFFGYKVMDYDYDNEDYGPDRYTYNARQQGPLAGLSLYW